MHLTRDGIFQAFTADTQHAYVLTEFKVRRPLDIVACFVDLLETTKPVSSQTTPKTHSPTGSPGPPHTPVSAPATVRWMDALQLRRFLDDLRLDHIQGPHETGVLQRFVPPTFLCNEVMQVPSMTQIVPILDTHA